MRQVALACILAAVLTGVSTAQGNNGTANNGQPQVLQCVLTYESLTGVSIDLPDYQVAAVQKLPAEPNPMIVKQAEVTANFALSQIPDQPITAKAKRCTCVSAIRPTPIRESDGGYH